MKWGRQRQTETDTDRDRQRQREIDRFLTVNIKSTAKFISVQNTNDANRSENLRQCSCHTHCMLEESYSAVILHSLYVGRVWFSVHFTLTLRLHVNLFCPTPGFKKRIRDSSEFLTEGSLISASTVPHRKKRVSSFLFWAQSTTKDYN